MTRHRPVFYLFPVLLVAGLLWLTACGDEYPSDSYDSHNQSEATADALSMSVVSSSIIELDWEQKGDSDAYRLYRRDDGGAEKLVYQGKGNHYEDAGLKNGVMYCYRLKICAEECSPVSDSVCGTTRQWKSHGQAPWSARRYHASVVFKDRLWLMGGEYFDLEVLSQAYNDVWTFDGGKWSLVISSAPWSGRADHASVVFDDKIWILGGDNLSGPLNDIWSSGDGKNWDLITAHAPWTARGLHAALVFQNKIWIMAGRDSTSYDRNDVWVSGDGRNWKQVTAGAPWPKSAYHTFLAFQNKIWMLEGDEWNTSSTRNVWTSADGKNWQKTTIQGSKQTVNNGLIFKNRIWLTGGFYGDGISSEVWLSRDGLKWFRDAPAPWPGRYGHGAMVFKDKIWVFGGVEHFPDHLEFNDVWSY